MNLFGKIIGAIAAVLIVIIALGYILPDRAYVERAVVIKAPQERVFALVGDFNQWDKWSPWADIDPGTYYTITGEGLGHRMEWVSENPEVGNGSQEITAFEPPNKIATHLEFEGMGGADAVILLTPVEGGTQVTWSFETEMRKGVPIWMAPASTYLGFFMDGMVGKDYEKGLAQLKTAAEAA